MAMQAYQFSDASGYVAHGIKLTSYASRFSVWYAADGRIIDVEAKDKRGRVRPFKLTTHLRLHLGSCFGMVVALAKGNAPLTGYHTQHRLG